MDGSIGSVSDLLFEDTSWAVRWVVVDTGTWLSGRKVLLPPSSLGRLELEPQEFAVELSRRQVEESPEVDFDAPVSRQLETRVYSHYGWGPYWEYPPLMPVGVAGVAPLPLADEVQQRPERRDEPTGDPHLRSVTEVTGYYVHATDGDIGHVEEVLVEQERWAIRYVMVDTRNWWPGRKVLVAAGSVGDIDWSAQKISVDLTRDQVKSSPEYDPAAALERRDEERLNAHYGLTPYWT